MKFPVPIHSLMLDGFLLLGCIAAWTHGWGFWAGLFWLYWLAVYVIKVIS
jgi:hypothetical protein